MKTYLYILLLILFPVSLLAQTLSETQMQNARATGYAIVAARNPGQSFSILMIQWDGINNLEHNANHQINPGWHAQAAVKGNYFTQPFDGTNFSNYSTVITSQEQFDIYKNQGTQWWIVCSTLGPFATTLYTTNGNVGIGTTNPQAKLSLLDNNLTSSPLHLYNASTGFSEIKKTFSPTDVSFSAGIRFITERTGDNYGSSIGFLTELNNISQHYDYRLYIKNDKVGIGTTNPTETLSVNGKIRAKEIKVEAAPWPDYVFNNSYQLPDLKDTERFIKENKHLPEIPSATEAEKDGINLGEMNAKLLKKIEELTLYLISLDKKVEEQQIEIKYLKNK